MRILICGATGFIGAHLARWLAEEGHDVRGADILPPRFEDAADIELMTGDLRDAAFAREVIDRPFDEIYQLAADMGGAGYIFTGDNDATVMHNSAAINLNVVDAARRTGAGRLFFSSSACIYPRHTQTDPLHPDCAEETAYPADPDSEYGWEKLFAERLYLAHARNFGMTVRIARYHNVFGPSCSWNDSREKAPAALARKVAEAADGGAIEIWGDGAQTRSFLYVDECIEGTLRLMRSDWSGPVNIGSEEMISISDLADLLIAISGKRIEKRFVPGPTGVRGRNSDNRLIREQLGWAPSRPLREGLERTYAWIAAQVAAASIGSASADVAQPPARAYA